MTEQAMHIPAHARSLILAAAQEASAVTTWTDREKTLSGLYTRHQEEANEELGALAAQIDELRVAFEARRAVLGEQGQHIASELADAGRRKDQHFEDAQDARQTLLDWCARRGVDPATLPTVTATESSGPLPVVSTGPQPAVTSGGHPVLPRPVRMSQVCAEGLHEQCCGHDERGGCDCPVPAHAGLQPQGDVLALTGDEVRQRMGLPLRGDQRPVLGDGDTTTTRAETPLPAPSGGEAPEAPFHPGDPDSDDTGHSDA